MITSDDFDRVAKDIRTALKKDLENKSLKLSMQDGVSPEVFRAGLNFAHDHWNKFDNDWMQENFMVSEVCADEWLMGEKYPRPNVRRLYLIMTFEEWIDDLAANVTYKLPTTLPAPAND